jgi:hypothetical protein
MDNSVRQPFGYLCSPFETLHIVRSSSQSLIGTVFPLDRPRRRNRHAPQGDRDDLRKPAKPADAFRVSCLPVASGKS